MFILYALVLGVLAGFALGGRMAGLGALQLHWSWAILGGLLFQVALFSGPVAQRIGDLGPWLYVGSTLVVVAAMVRNLSVPGMAVVIAGSACNLTAVLANGGFMPAAPAALTAAGRALPATYVNSSVVPDPILWPLTDIFALPSRLPFANVFSVGDVLIGAGIALIVITQMRRPVPAAAPTPAPVADPLADAAGGGAAAH